MSQGCLPAASNRRSRASTGRGLDGRSATDRVGSGRDVRRGPVDDSVMASAARKRASVAGGRREKYREDMRVARVDVDDLGTACRPGDQADGAAADGERTGHCCQCRFCRLAVHGPGPHGDDQGAGVLPANTWPCRAGLHPYSDPHAASIDICPSRSTSTSGPNADPYSSRSLSAVRRANSLSAGVRLCRAERGFLRAEADDVGGNADLRSRP